MAIPLAKRGNISLSKTNPSLYEIMVGLGWDARSTDGKPFDLDVSPFAFLLKAGGNVRSDGAFCFYNTLNVADGSVVHNVKAAL
jgi:tellurium resistance protein TerD